MKGSTNKYKITICILVLVLCVSLMANVTVAKYISSVSGSSSAQVAMWSFEVNDVQMASATPQTMTVNLFDTIYEEDTVSAENHVAEGLIAPGTGGQFTVKIDNLSEVDAEFDLTLTETNSDNIPIQYSTDLSTWKDSVSDLSIRGQFIDMKTGTYSVTLYWRWCFDGSTSEAHSGQTDTTDTSLGILAQTQDVELSVNMSLVMEQYQGESSSVQLGYFSIGFEEFQCEIGMTWEEFVSSKYNNGCFKCGYYVEYVTSEDAISTVVATEVGFDVYEPVSITDIIVPSDWVDFSVPVAYNTITEPEE